MSNTKQQENKHEVLMNYLLTKLPSYQLTKQQVEWIHHYFEKSPESLKQIIEQVESILSDGVINIEDVPAIIKCISTIYHERALLMEMADLSNLILLVRYTLDCMIDTNMVATNYFEKKTLEFVVNSSLDLLQYQFVPTAPSTTANKETKEVETPPPKNTKIEKDVYEEDTCCSCLHFYSPKK